MKPLISVIVPIYNSGNFLRECIESILSQSFIKLELILVNDGSTDQSGDICDEFAVIDSRVKVIHQKNGGVSIARNSGLNIANGKYIGFVDSDDRIDKNMYKVLYQLCVETNSDISVCQLGREIDGNLINNNSIKFIKEMENSEAMEELFKGVLFRFSLVNKLFSKSCFDNILFPEGRIHEDLSVTYQLFAKSKRTVYTNYIGYIYVKTENSILTSKFSKKRLDAYVAWYEILPFMKKNYKQFYNLVISCYVYWCVDNIFYILNQVENKDNKEAYLRIIRESIAINSKEVIMNDSLSLKYKYILLLFYFNENLLSISHVVKKKIFK